MVIDVICYQMLSQQIEDISFQEREPPSSNTMRSMTVQRPTTTCLAAVLLSLLLLLEGLENTNNGGFLLVVKAFNLQSHQNNVLSCSTARRIIKTTTSAAAAAPPRRRRDESTTTTTTELCMGLRDFLRGRLGKKGEEQQDGRKLKLPPPIRADDDEEDDVYDFLDGGNDDDDNEDDLSISRTRSIFENVVSEDGDDDVETIPAAVAAATAPYLRMGEDPDSKEINVFSLDEKESIQERINRVKSGKMSEEEKQAFLKTSLSGATTESKSRRLPLRPPSADSYYGMASPFPGDPILRSIAGQKNSNENDNEQPVSAAASAQNFIMDKVGIDSQKKKRDYLDMVTNPNRFDIYRTAATARLGGGSDGRTASVTEAAEAAANKAAAAAAKAAGLRSSTFSIGQANKAAAEAEANDESSSTKKSQSEDEEKASSLSSNTTTSDDEVKSSIAPLPADLGARLAAMAYEESRQKASSATTAPSNNKKPEKELTTFEKAAQQKLEQERMQQQMKVQDDYWTKRLAAERAARERAEAEGLNQQAQVSNKNPAWQRLSQKQGGSANIRDSGTAAAQNKRAFNPDERELLSKAEHDRNEAWEINQATINRSAARKDGSVPMDAVVTSLNDVQTEQQFINEQARRRANTDKIRDEQLERLRSLSSPLPSPAPRTTRGNTPSSRVVPAAPSPQYRPRQSSSQANGPTGSTRRSSSAKYKVDQSVDYLKNNMNDVRRQQEASKIAKGPQPSLNDVVRNREEKPSYQQMLSSLNDVQNSGRGGSVPTRGGTTGIQPLGYTKPSPGIQPMGYPTKKDPPVADSARVPPPSSSSQSAVESGQPSTQQQAPPVPVETNRPTIRMKLPLEDVEDEDEDVVEDGIDAHANRKMSIAEAMKKTTGGSGKGVDQDERSRKWGVDMSKFT